MTFQKILPVFPLALVLASGHSCLAQQYFGETFEGMSHTNFVTDFSPPWSTSDTWQSNGVEDSSVVNAPVASGSKVGFLGGYFSGNPVLGPAEPLPASLNFGFNAGGNSQFEFNWIQNLANPADDDGKRDVFGWAVRDLSGQALLSLKFIPAPLDTTTLDPDDIVPYVRNIGGVDHEFDTAVVGFEGEFWQEIPVETGDLYAGLFNRGEWTAFEIVLDTLTDTWSATINSIDGLSPFTFVSGASAVNTGAGLGALSAIWNPGDSDGIPASVTIEEGLVTSAGGNTLFVDNINVTAIPEPSSTALLGCGLALWFSTRRRVKSS